MSKRDRFIDVAFVGFMVLGLLGLVAGAVIRANERTKCNTKGGAYIDGECLRVERIP